LSTTDPGRRVGAEPYVIVRDTATDRVRPPLVPTIVRLNVPLVDRPDVTTVRVELVPVVEVGLKEAVTFAGSPVTVNATDTLEPNLREIVTA